MSESSGLRERKKDATRYRLSRTALELFEQRGFDEVSVAEIADAAEVSKKTVFNYFDVKEDLILGMGKQHIGDPAKVVCERPIGQTPHGAIREYWLKGLAERQPMTGLCDDTFVLRVIRLIRLTPALTSRQLHYEYATREMLAQALVEESGSELSARIMATQIFTVRQELGAENFRRIAAGATADEQYPAAVDAANHGFRLLEKGLGNLLRRAELYQRIPGYQPCGLTLGMGPLTVVK